MNTSGSRHGAEAEVLRVPLVDIHAFDVLFSYALLKS